MEMTMKQNETMATGIVSSAVDECDVLILCDEWMFE